MDEGGVEPTKLAASAGVAPPARTRSGAAARAVAGLGALVTVGAALHLTVGSLGWPLVHDGPLMHYVAMRWLEGAVPYRDLFDMNFPGVYLAHAAALRILGPGDLGFRLFDLGLVAAAGGGLLVALRGPRLLAGISAATLFCLYHVSGGAWLAGQRELLLCALLAWAAAAAVAGARSGGPLALGLAALAVGAAAWVKPHAALAGLGLVMLACRAPRRGLALLATGVGLLAPAAGALAWLAGTGALAAFADIVVGYLVPLYSRVGRAPLLAELVGRDYGWPVLAGLGAWAALGAMALGLARRTDGRATVLAGGVVYGLLHLWLQGRGWEYHFYPLALFAVALGGAGLGAALAIDRRGVAAALGAVLIVTAGGLHAKGLRNLDAAWIADKRARVDRVTEALRPLVAAGETVQVLDTTDGGIHALYRLGVRQPTRFVYDFHFYHHVEHPYVRRLRRELVDGLVRGRPAAVVLFERGWPEGGYERIDRFPELSAWLHAAYRLEREEPGFRLYAARSDR